MTDWNPAQYLLYGNERLRPALDLLARIQMTSPDTVYDLGCGTGTVTRILKERWPDAQVTGVDSSESMLERTQAVETGVYWQHSDLNDWQPENPADVVYSNAALHWLDNHERLFLRLMETVKPGGVLAVQMPREFQRPQPHIDLRNRPGRRLAGAFGTLSAGASSSRTILLLRPPEPVFQLYRHVGDHLHAHPRGPKSGGRVDKGYDDPSLTRQPDGGRRIGILKVIHGESG